MQITLDTGAPIDVEFKMSTDKDEMIINNVDDFFSHDVKKSGDIVKDVTSDIAENNDELKQLELNNKIAKDTTASKAESVENEKSTSDEPSRDDCESKDHSPKCDTSKQRKPEDVENNDDSIIQHQEPESQNKLKNHNTQENVVETDTSKKCDNDISKQKPNVIPKAELKDDINGDNSINNHEDTANASKTDSKENTVSLLETEITEKAEAKQTNNDTKNPDTESLILDNVIDEVPNKPDEKKDRSDKDDTESQRENSVSPISPKLDNDENKSTDSEIVTGSTLESTFKTDNSKKEIEITDSTSETTSKAKGNAKESELTDSTSESISKANINPKESELTYSTSESTSKADGKAKESELIDSTSENISKADISTKDSEITDSTSESTSKADGEAKESELTDSISERISKTEDSTKESKITEESVVSAENSAIEIEDEKLNDTETQKDKGRNENVESNVVKEQKESSLVSKLTNILDLLSDDEEEVQGGTSKNETINVDKQCISLVDDDDVMLIDEDTTAKEDAKTISNQADKFIPETCDMSTTTSKDDIMDTQHETGSEGVDHNLEKGLDSITNDSNECSTSKPLLSFDFLNNCKKKLADMTREELEEFCSLKIVESVMDRCNLSHLKTLIEKMADTVKEYENEILLLSKQNNVLQLAVNSVNDEQKKSVGTALAPLKITRSVGMQVLMTDKPNAKKKNPQIIKASAKPNQPSPIDKTNRNPSVQKLQKNKNQSIPVPRLVPAANTNKTSPAPASNTSVPGKFPQVTPVNGVRNSSPVQKPEKRSRVQSETVDLTDDEPPLKVTATSKSSPATGVRLVPAQNLLPQRPQFVPPMTSPRKVYIPISGPQSQNVRPEQTVVLKTVPPSPGLRPKILSNNVNKVQANTIRMNRPVSTGRHPAPLPDAVKQYQPTSWKALPPAPDLKLSKVENGIVISWKIDGYDEDSYEEIISYQLFAYHETNCPPSTAIWKKIGDVKALPLPMACTLTQFLAGYKYYFAVRAVDIKSRYGPFSLPASILLLNKI